MQSDGQMLIYSVKCLTCRRIEEYGLTRPESPQLCSSSKALRQKCKEPIGCNMALVEEERELSDIDKLRMGLREDKPIAFRNHEAK